MKKILFALLCLPLTITFAAPPPVFTIEPNGSLPTEVLAGGTVIASYTVKNTTPFELQSNGLRYAPAGKTPKGVTQVTGGTGVCADPFTLKAGKSCILNLLLTADQLAQGGAIGGPEVCNTKAHPSHCSVPSSANQLDVQVIGEGFPPSLAIGGSGVSPYVPFFIESMDLGALWTLGTPPAALTTGEFFSSACNTSLCLMGGATSTTIGMQAGALGILSYSLDGTTWTDVPMPGGSFSVLEDVACTSGHLTPTGICVAVGGIGLPSSPAYQFLMQNTASPPSWQAVTLPDQGILYGVTCTASLCVLVGVDVTNTGAALYQSSSPWTSWTSVIPGTAPASSLLGRVACVPAGNVCLAVGYTSSPINGFTVYTADGGSSWHTPASNVITNFQPLSLAYCPVTGSFIAGGLTSNVSPTPALLYTTSDNGTTWTSIPVTGSGTGNGLIAVVSGSSSLCVAVGYQNSTPVLMQTKGSGWVAVTPTSPIPSTTQFSDVACSGLFCYAAGTDGSGNGVMFQTRDGGSTWKPVDLTTIPIPGNVTFNLGNAG